VWLIASLVAIHRARNDLTSEQAAPPISEMRSISLAVWAFAIASVAIWAIVLPQTQPEQQRRRHAERLLFANKIDEAIVFMSQFEQTQFPPHWDPPPRIGYGEKQSNLVEILESLNTIHARPWLLELYREKHRYTFPIQFMNIGFWNFSSDQEYDQYLRQLELLPPDDKLIQQMRVALEGELKKPERKSFHERLSKLLDLPQDG
jgi:hypothetical protein